MYYQNEPRFNGVYSRDNLPDKIKDGAHLINLDEYSDIGTHWDYFIAEIKERELMSKRLSKYIDSFDYFGKSLIVLSGTSGSISFASFATVIGTPVGIAIASLSLAFSLSTLVVKNYLKKRNNNKKHNKVVMLARSKLNSIESKISEALMNNQISHEVFMTIKNYRELKKSIRMTKGQEDKEIGID